MAEVQKCHLHRKPNKTCKFCNAFLKFQEQKKIELEEKKKSELEEKKKSEWEEKKRLKADVEKEAPLPKTLLSLPPPVYRSPEEKPPLPNLRLFPSNLRRWIEVSSQFEDCVDMGLNIAMGMIEGCTSCESEISGRNGLKEPSQFLCCVYYLMTKQLTQGELDSMLNSRSCYLRCAGCLYVRLAFAQEEYWDMLSGLLMDNYEFLPFPEESYHSITVGKYVEDLLTKEKYCDIVLPRIHLGIKNSIDMRLALYEQFRRRYACHLEALDAFNRPGVDVEICSTDGTWSDAVTIGSPSGQCITVPVRLHNGEQRHVSIGMIIIPSTEATHDLRRSRGRSTQELLDRYRERAKGSALAVGKDYCKTQLGSTRICNQLVVPCRERKKDEDIEREEEEAERYAKRRREVRERDEKRARIESKYCTSRPVQQPRPTHDVLDAPEGMRLG